MPARVFALAPTARAASITELPAVTVCRLANPPRPTGTTEESPATTVTFSGLRPNS
jgi:hypothetical protein